MDFKSWILSIESRVIKKSLLEDSNHHNLIRLELPYFHISWIYYYYLSMNRDFEQQNIFLRFVNLLTNNF